MKAFEIEEFGIDRLALVERDVPVPGPFEVLVRMTAASLNYRDLMVVRGLYNPRLKRPMTPLSDGVGVVEAIGPGVTRFKAGDRVTPCFMQGWIDGPPTREKNTTALGGSIQGVLREYAAFSEQGLVTAPLQLSDVEAAALPCAAVTAWHALFEAIPAQPGETVLLQGTGGVSLFALQFAKAAGLRTILTSSSDEKIARARQLGANETINYKANPDWDKEARRLTGGTGVDRVIELGGSGTFPKSVQAVRVNGVVSTIGALTGVDASISPVPILMNSLLIQGIYVGSRTMFERMNQAIALHHIRPVIDRTFPWTDLPAALRYMESQRHFGKICLTFGG
jgi:NADPH:quinone reductase-like Zn-dependent oxidoreductase